MTRENADQENSWKKRLFGDRDLDRDHEVDVEDLDAETKAELESIGPDELLEELDESDQEGDA